MQRGTRLLKKLEHELLLSARQRRLLRAFNDKPKLLQQQVQLQQLEDELALQQQQAQQQAQTKSAFTGRSLRAERRQQAADVLKEQAEENDKVTRRLCQVLTEGRRSKSLPCRGPQVDTSPELPSVLEGPARQQSVAKPCRPKGPRWRPY